MNFSSDSYKETLNIVRRELKGKDFHKIAERAGGEFKKGCILIPYINHTLKIDTGNLEVYSLDSSSRVEPRVEILTLHYLKDAKNIKPSGRLINFKEIPSGMSYYPSFHNRTEKVLLKEFRDDFNSFKRICERLGGEKCQQGDICYRIRTFPLLYVTFIVWEGEEGLPPGISILFDETSPHHLLSEDLAILAELLCEEMVSLRKDVIYGSRV
ncbi:MAG TPA: DUF3786 domain-containing protein [Candidatus Omnitrophica bacterium]|nr:DUF3786 domain-containing protein [Candidatus Omnitrophota bacterium]